ncbi:MAG: alpha/beta fold hydrolase [Alphaproteobacteria bacterium]|nr:alpha/beta fold hydrolase [Alphaproteobacteria bacterium]
MRAILIVLASLASIAAAHAAALEGHWAGTWTKAGDALNVTVEFSKANSRYAGSFDSDGLQVAGIPFAGVAMTGNAVRFTLKGDRTTTTFDGSLSNDTIAGTFKDGDVPGTFKLMRATTPPQVETREVTFANGDVTLAGELVLPATPGRYPALMFLHGSGAEGRWANRYLARKFATRGFVALIYDKRGVGASKGDWQSSGFEELAEDAVAGIRFLASHKAVLPERIGIYGHSQGGTISPLVAVRARGAAFLIASAASGLDPAETETYSIENSIGVATLPVTERADARLFVAAIVDVAYRGALYSTLEDVVERFRGRSWFFEPPPRGHSYWSISRRIRLYRPLEFWEQVRAPVFLVFGAHDERVPPQRSADAILAALNSTGNKRVTLRIYPNAEHAFRIVPQDPPGGWSKRVPDYADTLATWAQSKH